MNVITFLNSNSEVYEVDTDGTGTGTRQKRKKQKGMRQTVSLVRTPDLEVNTMGKTKTNSQ